MTFARFDAGAVSSWCRGERAEVLDAGTPEATFVDSFRFNILRGLLMLISEAILLEACDESSGIGNGGSKTDVGNTFRRVPPACDDVAADLT